MRDMEWPNEKSPDEEFLADYFSSHQVYEYPSFEASPKEAIEDFDEPIENPQSLKNDYEGFEAALLKIANLDPLESGKGYGYFNEDEEPSDPKVIPKLDTFVSEGIKSESIDLDHIPSNDDEFIEIPFNPEPSYNFHYQNPFTGEEAEYVFKGDASSKVDPVEEQPLAREVPSEAGTFGKSGAERRFMGARSYVDPYPSKGTDEGRKRTPGISADAFNALRRTALFANPETSVRKSYFEVMDPEEDGNSIESDSDGLGNDHMPTSSIKLKVGTNNANDTVQPPKQRQIITFGVSSAISPHSSEITGFSSRVGRGKAPSNSAEHSVVDRAKSAPITASPGNPSDESRGNEEGFFKDLETKNNIFGNTMELDSKRVAKESNQAHPIPWSRGDDDLFSTNANIDSSSHSKGRRGSRRKNEIASDPITAEITITQPAKKSKIMAILTKKL
ncbi:hypothetical protein [Acidithrix sp. C25]|uniref:hypothetical protein n=1 Tax=Acidithrix sp. C25 TaxID=1671482 RepID=UPI00191BC9A3|nr:hypothetical protein [Acidithrix sp. C25]